MNDNDERTGDWFLSFTGRRIYPFDMRASDVCVEDIAHSLSNLCRFNGHCKVFYSVAQHSVLMASLVESDINRLPALMHDATEAYCGDMIRPIKLSMRNFAEMEDRIWIAIADRFGLPYNLPPAIKEADRRMVVTEHRDILITSPVWPSHANVAPYWMRIHPWSNEIAERIFLETFDALGRRPVSGQRFGRSRRRKLEKKIREQEWLIQTQQRRLHEAYDALHDIDSAMREVCPAVMRAPDMMTDREITTWMMPRRPRMHFSRLLSADQTSIDIQHLVTEVFRIRAELPKDSSLGDMQHVNLKVHMGGRTFLTSYAATHEALRAMPETFARRLSNMAHEALLQEIRAKFPPPAQEEDW